MFNWTLQFSHTNCNCIRANDDTNDRHARRRRRLKDIGINVSELSAEANSDLCGLFMPIQILDNTVYKWCSLIQAVQWWRSAHRVTINYDNIEEGDLIQPELKNNNKKS